MMRIPDPVLLLLAAILAELQFQNDNSRVLQEFPPARKKLKALRDNVPQSAMAILQAVEQAGDTAAKLAEAADAAPAVTAKELGERLDPAPVAEAEAELGDQERASENDTGETTVFQ